jgi:hypothetical protein
VTTDELRQRLHAISEDDGRWIDEVFFRATPAQLAYVAEMVGEIDPDQLHVFGTLYALRRDMAYIIETFL